MDCRVLYDEMSKIIPSIRDISPQYSNSNSPPGDFDDSSSIFSYEDIGWGETVNGSTRSSISSIGSFAHVSSDPEGDVRTINIGGPISISPTSARSFSLSSVTSVRLNPSVPLTPPGGNSRNHSVCSNGISNFILKSPPSSKRRTSSVSQRDLFTVKEDPSQHKSTDTEKRTHKSHSSRSKRSGTENGQSSSRKLNETSALLHTTSHRIDQGMALLLQTLQRLEFLEKKVEGVVSKKPSIHTGQGRMSSPASPDPDRIQMYSSPRAHCSSQATNVIIRSTHTSPVESRASSTC
ncbi:hypothetical protein CONCODRAFT_77806 [Conidiobolus coronatus NRRL 28638]|uniref:Uncharacterized protein n=1 Tax=Conidiobolus coronatus (strain ATCC 28846 / CBS 209.66 / NRRL 28638) TaxID=796925 RepID=A0A137PBQ5_CONC2|nr:hypothetical protein CONCODRAFT_77806 [Conidiobolus coronatus NRRL 28638]|eukprot:KXN72439.1 hypothetical protein CONCODRAFT_77806 [Conidiobolus coronatus NRRL 28638]